MRMQEKAKDEFFENLRKPKKEVQKTDEEMIVDFLQQSNWIKSKEEFAELFADKKHTMLIEIIKSMNKVRTSRKEEEIKKHREVYEQKLQKAKDDQERKKERERERRI